MAYPVIYVTETDGWTVVVFGCYCAIYKISRGLNYLAINDRHYHPCIHFIRTLKNPLPITHAALITSPLYSIILTDNASVRCYSINGQFIKQQHCSAKGDLTVMKDGDMNEYVCFYEEDRIVVMSTPDLRMIGEIELGEGVSVQGRLLVWEDKVGVIGW